MSGAAARWIPGQLLQTDLGRLRVESVEVRCGRKDGSIEVTLTFYCDSIFLLPGEVACEPEDGTLRQLTFQRVSIEPFGEQAHVGSWTNATRMGSSARRHAGLGRFHGLVRNNV